MKPIFISGPCVIESMELLDTVAQELVRLNKKYEIEIIFKSSLIKPTGHLFTLIAGRDWRKAYRCWQT